MSFFVAGVNELSRKVFAASIPNKSWQALEPVLIQFLTQSPSVRTLTVDGEAALSQRHIKELKEKINRPWLKVIRAPKKAYLAERFIRTIKFKLAEFCKKDKIHIAQGWRSRLKKVVKFCNTKLVLENGMTPSSVTLENFLSVEQALNPEIMAPLSNPDARAFKFKEGEILTIKDRALNFPDKIGLKRSVQGYNSAVKDLVVAKEIRVTGRRSKFLTPYYKLANQGWFRQSDLAR